MIGSVGAKYLYDGHQLAGAVISGTTIANRLVLGPWPDELVVAYQGSDASTPLWALQDVRGSTIAYADAAGNAPYILAYDEYGQPRSGNAGRLQYTGQLWLPDFGAYYYKARTYQPGLGRFLQTDPMGYAAGMNLYGYVGGDPINRIDPFGLCGNPGEEACEVDDVHVNALRCAADARVCNRVPNSPNLPIGTSGGGKTGGGGTGPATPVSEVLFIPHSCSSARYQLAIAQQNAREADFLNTVSNATGAEVIGDLVQESLNQARIRRRILPPGPVVTGVRTAVAGLRLFSLPIAATLFFYQLSESGVDRGEIVHSAERYVKELCD